MVSNEAQEQLDYIKNVIQESRKTIQNDGLNFLLWGIIVSAGLLLTYFLELFRWRTEWTIFVWLILISLGWMLTWYEYRKMREARVSFFADRVIGGIWLGCGVALSILGFIGPWSCAYSSLYITAVLACVMGIGYFVTGFVTGYCWFKIAGYVWWIISIYMFYFPGLYTLLIFAVMMICVQVIPGAILNRQYRRQHAVKEL